MERVRELNRRCSRFCAEVIEWRSPFTALYIMALNAAFWSICLCVDNTIKLRTLVGLSAAIFSFDILFSSTNDRSIGLHIVLWPLHSIWKTAAVGLNAYSAHALQHEDPMKACCVAYASLVCLTINPVWCYYEVNTKIADVGRDVGRAIGRGVQIGIVSPVVAVYEAVKYIVLLRFIPPLWKRICEFFAKLRTAMHGGFSSFVKFVIDTVRSIKQWISNSILLPLYNGLCAVGRFLRYWLCAGWWPSLKAAMQQGIVNPLRHAFNYVCFWTVYIVCFKWLPPLARMIGQQLRRFGAFIHRTALVPLKMWLLKQAQAFRVWLRGVLHSLALAIRDSVLWPVCVLVVEISKQLYGVFHRTCVYPVYLYIYQRYKILETGALVYFLGPVCETIVNNIPEKSPFCDDSDVELEGMLPEDTTDTEDDGVAQHAPLVTSTRSSSPNSDFASGLSFPAIHDSESSDDDIDLQTRKQVRRRRKTSPRKEGGSESAQREIDDDFELLQ